MAVHIGKVIKGLVKQKGLGVTAFADKINYSRRNVYEIFDRETIDTGLLIKIGKILSENLFFNYLSDEEIAEYKNDKVKAVEILNALKDLKATMIALNEERKMQKIVKSKKRAVKKSKNK